MKFIPKGTYTEELGGNGTRPSVAARRWHMNIEDITEDMFARDLPPAGAAPHGVLFG
jgi:hypothetical protein